MIKLVFAHSTENAQYPPYVNVSAVPGHDELRVVVRGPARSVDGEGGPYLEIGETAESLLARENAMELARAIIKHYEQTPIKIDPKGDHGIGPELRAKFFPDDHLSGETHRVYEETERVGELSYTRRLTIDSMDDPLQAQVKRLAGFILANFEEEPSGDLTESSIDVAIRLLGDYAALLHAQKAFDDTRFRESCDHIAEGLRKGQAKSFNLETPETTVAPDGFVNAGTHAEGVSYDDPGFDKQVVEAGRRDGANAFAQYSAPLGGAVIYPDERAYQPPIETRAPEAFDVVSPQPEDDEIPF